MSSGGDVIVYGPNDGEHVAVIHHAEGLPGAGPAVLDRPELDDDIGTDDWYAIKGEEPWRMGCGRSGIHMAETRCPHRVIVWPAETDPNLMEALRMLLSEDGEIGEVVRYERTFGPAISYYRMCPS